MDLPDSPGCSGPRLPPGRQTSATHEQIDYVPAQIITKYLRRIFAEGQLITGLLYRGTRKAARRARSGWRRRA
jgi:hypothetical protein